MSTLHEAARYIEVLAEVRYWEDATVNGVEDTDGTLIPHRDPGNVWAVTLSLATGRILAWPEGVEAEIHYKVCDAGVYYLLDEDANRIARHEGYVPAGLCHGGNGYGDYIIMDIDGDGRIRQYQRPDIDDDVWEDLR